MAATSRLRTRGYRQRRFRFPGASRKTYASLDSGSALNVSVNPGAIVPSADVSIGSLVATPQPVAAGSQLTYEMVVRNDGPNAASSVKVTDTLPAAVAFVSASSSQGQLVEPRR